MGTLSQKPGTRNNNTRKARKERFERGLNCGQTRCYFAFMRFVKSLKSRGIIMHLLIVWYQAYGQYGRNLLRQAQSHSLNFLPLNVHVNVSSIIHGQ